MKKAIFFCLSIFLLLQSLSAQDDFQNEIEIFQKDTIRGVLKNGKPWSGTFVFAKDIFGFNELLKKGFDPVEGRFEGELVFPNSYFSKKIDIHYATTKVEYVNGEASGTIAFYNKRDWNSRWAMIFKSNIHRGQLDGTYTTYYRNQKDELMAFAKLSYLNGKKEGEVVFYSREGAEYGKGIYKNDLPYSGKFNQSHLEFEKYEDGEKVYQVQRIIPLDEDSSPGIDGELPKHPTKIYGPYNWRFVHLIEGAYRNGRPWTGEFYSAEIGEHKIYKEGRIVQQVLIHSSGWACIETNFDEEGQTTTQHFYENYNSINLKTDSLKYKGVYVNGKKNEGDFFDLDEEFPKLLLHSRYKSGVLQKQTFLEFEKYWNPTSEGDLSCIYENGEVKNGIQIEVMQQGLVFQKEYKKGVLTHTSEVPQHLFPEQRFAMKVQAEAKGYSVLDHREELFSRLLYSTPDSTAGSITYFEKEKEKGKIYFENNKITNGDCEFSVLGFKIKEDMKITIRIRNGVYNYNQIFRDFEFRSNETLDQKIPISFYAFRTPKSVSVKRQDIYWAGTNERICSLHNEPTNGILVMNDWIDDSYLITAFQNNETVEDFTVAGKLELEKELERLKLVYGFED